MKLYGRLFHWHTVAGKKCACKNLRNIGKARTYVGES